MNCVLLTLIVFILIVNPISGKGSCYDWCTKTTYCLSTTGTSCNSDTLVTSTWSVSQTDRNDLVTLALTARNVKQSEFRALSMAFISAALSTNYTCSKSPSGTVSLSVIQKDERTIRQIIPSGLSSYSGGVLTCSWSFTKYNNTWPLYFNGGAQLMWDSRGSLELRSGNRSAIVADNVSDLPTYQLKYLKCCNKVHGNNGYLAIFNQTTDNNYLLRVIGRKPQLVTLSLNSSSRMQLTFNCYFGASTVEGFLSNSSKTISITNKMYKRYANALDNPVCSWSHPLLLIGTNGKLDTVNQLFDMQIISDGKVIYTEKGVNLRNSASTFAFHSLILVLVAISMKLMIQ